MKKKETGMHVNHYISTQSQKRSKINIRKEFEYKFTSKFISEFISKQKRTKKMQGLRAPLTASQF